MLNATPAYKAAIIGDSRQMFINAKVHIVDPDIVYGAVGGSAQYSGVSRSAQLYDDVQETGKHYITLEPNRWLLDGTFDAIENVPASDEVGWVANSPQSYNGAGTRTVELSFSGVDVLNACTIAFPDNEIEGYPVEITITIFSGDTVGYTKAITDNASHIIKASGFTVNNPTKIQVAVNKWSLPQRRVRVTEIVAGVHEEWSDSVISSFNVVHQANISGTTLPYGTANIVFDNTDHRFDPYNKVGLFASLEERQGIDLLLGCGVDGSVEYKKLGVFYQYADGWKMRSGLTITWSLVDIIGLLADRAYKVPSTLPTTLEGWVSQMLGQLGSDFGTRYEIETGYATLNITATSANDLQNQTCGQLLMWLCQASGLWAVADAQSGYLKLIKLSETTIPSKNLYNEALRTDGYYLSSGGVPTAADGSSYSAAIPIEYGKTYTFSGISGKEGSNNKRIKWYTNDDPPSTTNVISSPDPIAVTGVGVPYQKTFSVWDNRVQYMRISINTADTEVMVEEGSVKTEYEPYGEIIVSDSEITLANQNAYPTIKSNQDIARIDFTYPNGTVYSVQGNIDAATVISIKNPFINNSTKADAAAAVIMASYGGNSIETVGRGDPTDELGDIIAVQTEQGEILGRLIYADYRFSNGVLTGCVSKMIEVTE